MSDLMGNIKSLFMIFLLGSVLVPGIFFAQSAHAFSCTSNGVSIGGAGTFTIPVNATVSKSTTDIMLTDMGQYTTCSGWLSSSYQDALQITSSALSAAFSSIGFSGYANIWGTRYNFPLPTKCIWPDGNCMSGPASFTGPVNMQIGIQRAAQGAWVARTLPAGTEIARFSVTQRGNYGGSSPGWGNPKTWIFVLQNALVLPAYTCTWTNPNQTVNLPPVNARDIRNNGAGVYPSGSDFKLNLACDPQTTVSVQFDGTAMPNTSNSVLANSAQNNSPVGVQMQYKNTPVVLGRNVQVIANAQSQETISLKAFYYYNGGDITATSVSAVTTVTLSYN